MGRLLDGYWKDEQHVWRLQGAFFHDRGSWHTICVSHPKDADIEVRDLADELHGIVTLDVAQGVIRTREDLHALQETLPNDLHIYLVPTGSFPYTPITDLYV